MDTEKHSLYRKIILYACYVATVFFFVCGAYRLAAQDMFGIVYIGIGILFAFLALAKYLASGIMYMCIIIAEKLESLKNKKP